MSQWKTLIGVSQDVYHMIANSSIRRSAFAWRSRVIIYFGDGSIWFSSLSPVREFSARTLLRRSVRRRRAAFACKMLYWAASFAINQTLSIAWCDYRHRVLCWLRSLGDPDKGPCVLRDAGHPDPEYTRSFFLDPISRIAFPCG